MDQEQKKSTKIETLRAFLFLTQEEENLKELSSISLVTIKYLLDKKIIERDKETDKQLAYKRIALELVRRIKSGCLSEEDTILIAIRTHPDFIRACEQRILVIKHAELFKQIYRALRIAQTNLCVIKTNFLAGKEDLPAKEFLREVDKLAAAYQKVNDEKMPRSLKAYILFVKYKGIIFDKDNEFDKAELKKLKIEIHQYGYINSNEFFRATRYPQLMYSSPPVEFTPTEGKSDRSGMIAQMFKK